MRLICLCGILLCLTMSNYFPRIRKRSVGDTAFTKGSQADDLHSRLPSHTIAYRSWAWPNFADLGRPPIHSLPCRGLYRHQAWQPPHERLVAQRTKVAQYGLGWRDGCPAGRRRGRHTPLLIVIKTMGSQFLETNSCSAIFASQPGGESIGGLVGTSRWPCISGFGLKCSAIVVPLLERRGQVTGGEKRPTATASDRPQALNHDGGGADCARRPEGGPTAS